jgi:hypothetical protein
MTEYSTTDLTSLVDSYIAMWNETDPDRRVELIERAWVLDARYVDPLLEADGHAALAQMVATVQSHYPGHRFRRTSGVDAHHDSARFAWELVAPDGAVTVGGIDAAVLANDGRLARITGFFGELPTDTAA